MSCILEFMHPVQLPYKLGFLFFVAGMNTGIQDVHKLAWKIASFMKGIAPSLIVHTYKMERRLV